MKLCSCPLESMYCIALKKCPGVHPTSDKYSVPSTKIRFLQNMLDDFNIITTSLIPANKCSMRNKHTILNKSKQFLEQCSVFLQGQHSSKIASTVFLEELHHALWRSAVCISKYPPLLSMSSTPFRKINMQYDWHRASLSKVQNVWNCKHYYRMLFCFLRRKNGIYSPVWSKNLPEKKPHSYKTGQFLLDMCIYSSPWSDQPSLYLDNSHLKKCVQYSLTIIIFVWSNISLISRGCCTNWTRDSSRTTILFQKSATCVQNTICSSNVWLYGFKDAHSLNYNVFQEESCLYQRAIFPK